MKDREVTYHVHPLRFYLVGPIQDDIFHQRRDLNNLLEWMLFEGRKWVGVLLAVSF